MTPDEKLANLANRITIMGEQLEVIRKKGISPNSPLTDLLWQGINEAAEEIENIRKLLIP